MNGLVRLWGKAGWGVTGCCTVSAVLLWGVLFKCLGAGSVGAAWAPAPLASAFAAGVIQAAWLCASQSGSETASALLCGPLRAGAHAHGVAPGRAAAAVSDGARQPAEAGLPLLAGLLSRLWSFAPRKIGGLWWRRGERTAVGFAEPCTGRGKSGTFGPNNLFSLGPCGRSRFIQFIIPGAEGPRVH